MSKKENTNPMHYVYPEGQMVEIEGRLLTNLMETLEHLILDETKEEVSFKYSYFNTKTGKIVKNFKDEDLETGIVQKVPDHQKMMEASTERVMTAKGVELMRLRYYLATLHNENVEKGKAVHIEELLENQTNQETKEVK